ncbi:MAG: hypothetical protein ACFB6S_11550 [Geminicoccaceae bacterium]
MKAWQVISALLFLLGGSVFGVWYVGRSLDGEIARNGWIALGVGGGLTLLITVLLMALIFISRARGYDDRAGKR